MINRLDSLSGNIVRFCRYLRNRGFPVSAEEEATALKALQFIDYSSYYYFALTLKAVLCRNKNQLDQFDEICNDYWKELEKTVDAKLKEETVKNPSLHSPQEQFKSLKTWLHGNRNNKTEETATYSRQENLTQKDFSTVPEDEVGELMLIIKSLSKQLAARVNRRYENSRAKNLADLRKTIRKNLRRGGELLDIVYRKPKRNRVKLVLFCDVSRSMELYTAFLLQFMYAFQQVYSRVETFVFSTSLQRITSLLKEHDFREAMQCLNPESKSWSGGTRIGESLNAFTTEYGKKLLDKKTIVIILSDGWDTGDTELLQQNMELIHAKARKLIWLNPLAGYEAYKPDVAGMKAAMPYTDIFISAHNVESLRKLASVLR